MTPLLSRLFSRGAAPAEVFQPLATVAGVTDYIFLDAAGKPVTRTSNFGYDDERLHACTEALRRAAALVGHYLDDEAHPDEVFAFRFRNGWFLLWRLGPASLIVFGREALDLPTLRMRVNILRSQMADDRRLRRYLAGGPETGPDWLRATARSEQEGRWIDTICGHRAP